MKRLIVVGVVGALTLMPMGNAADAVVSMADHNTVAAVTSIDGVPPTHALLRTECLYCEHDWDTNDCVWNPALADWDCWFWARRGVECQGLEPICFKCTGFWEFNDSCDDIPEANVGYYSPMDMGFAYPCPDSNDLCDDEGLASIITEILEYVDDGNAEAFAEAVLRSDGRTFLTEDGQSISATDCRGEVVLHVGISEALQSALERASSNQNRDSISPLLFFAIAGFIGVGILPRRK